jgi:putative endonuclease
VIRVQSNWSIYFVRCRDGAIYTGIATDVARRFAEHEASGSRAARFLRGRGPLTLIASSTVGSRSEALRLEASIKRFSRRRKLAMLSDHAELVQVLDRLRAEAAPQD